MEKTQSDQQEQTDQLNEQLARQLGLNAELIRGIRQRFQTNDAKEIARLSNEYQILKQQVISNGDQADDNEVLDYIQYRKEGDKKASQPQQTQQSGQQQQPGQVQQPAQSQQQYQSGQGESVNFEQAYPQGFQFRPKSESDYTGQCAWYSQQITRLEDGGTWTVGNTINQKKGAINRLMGQGKAFKPGQEQVKPGQSLVLDTGGKWGHVATVAEVLPDGRVRLSESNLDGDQRVRNDRIIDPRDNNVVGIIKTKPTSQFQVQPPKTDPSTPTSPEQNPPPNNVAAGKQEAKEKDIQPVPEDFQAGNPNVKGKTPEEVATSSDNFDQLLEGIPQNQREDAKKAIPQLAQALEKEGILTPKTLSYAIATVGGESGFVPKSEVMAQRGINSRNDYIANLQQNYEGGADYHGRGYIQLTHKGNYDKFGKRIGVDLVNNPDALLDPAVSAKVVAAYFKDNGVADAVENGNYDQARTLIQGKGALNPQFAEHTKQIENQARTLEQKLGNPEQMKLITQDQTAEIAGKQENPFGTDSLIPKGIIEQTKVPSILDPFTKGIGMEDVQNKTNDQLVSEYQKKQEELKQAQQQSFLPAQNQQTTQQNQPSARPTIQQNNQPTQSVNRAPTNSFKPAPSVGKAPTSSYSAPKASPKPTITSYKPAPTQSKAPVMSKAPTVSKPVMSVAPKMSVFKPAPAPTQSRASQAVSSAKKTVSNVVNKISSLFRR